MTNKSLAIAIGAALLVPTFAFAEVQVVNGEAGMIFKDQPSTITRAEVRAQMKSPIPSQSGWLYVGGEAGWTAPSAKFEFDHGQLVHASDCPVLATLNAPKAKGSNEPLPGYTGA